MTAIDQAQLLDIHTHWRPAGWPGGAALVDGEPDPREDLAALAAESAEAGVDARALSAPVESLFGPDGDVPSSAVNVVNEDLAEQLAAFPGFLGLATVDGHSGEAGAEQVRYGIETLGLAGIVLDSARHGRFLNAPQVLPTLETAARLRVPVFVHPVQPPQADVLREAAGPDGNLAGRGLQNGVALLSALRAELPARLPDLHLVFTALGHGALCYAADALADYRVKTGAGANVYLDTMRFNPLLLRYVADVLGADRIVIGSDWPAGRDARRAHIDRTLAAAGFDAAAQELIRIGNARRLFGLRGAPGPGEP